MRFTKAPVSAFCFSLAAVGAAGPAIAGAAYTYDALGRVVSVRYDDGKQIVYVYDPAGNRTQEVVSATTINRAPIAVLDAVTLTEDQPSLALSPMANDSDPDTNPLALFSVAGGDFGTATSSGSSVTYASSYKRNAVDKLAYTITDGQGMNASGEITVTLANLNPIAVNDSATTNQTQGIFVDPRTNDSDPGGDTFKVTAVSTPAHGTATISSGGVSVWYAPAGSYVGGDSYTYTITDVDGGTATATVNVAVNNLPPVAYDDNVTGPNGSIPAFDARVNDNDPGTDPISVISVTQPSHGTATITQSGWIFYSPLTGFYGLDLFTYTISDGVGGMATATVRVTVQ